MGARSASETQRGYAEEPAAAVVVPATSANLGCAFDCAGIALNLYLRAQATPSDAPGVSVSYRGANAERIPADGSNLVVQAMQNAAAHCGATLPVAGRGGPNGLRLDLQNDIPLGAGLGSSAAAIVAGIVLGSELCGAELSAAEALRLALEIETHPDNLAAAIHGGFVVAALPADSPDALIARTRVSEELEFIAVIPETPLPTAEARAALPASYSRQDVIANLQHTALLTAAFFSGQPLSPELFGDRLHQPYRSALVPGIAGCLAYRHPDLAGIFLSGAGSAVMAVVERAAASKQKIAADLVAEFRKQGTLAHAQALRADNVGTRVTRRGEERLLAETARAPAIPQTDRTP